MWNPEVTPVYGLKSSGAFPHPEVTDSGILFSVVSCKGEDASLLLYERGSCNVKYEIPFPDEPSTGLIRSMIIAGVPASEFEYNYRISGNVITDPSAQAVIGLERFGERMNHTVHEVRGGLIDLHYDWGEDKHPLVIPYSDSVFYELHVRGFTKSVSSKVRHRGTFLGLAEKISYLKELGITAVVLMPCYEFDEMLPAYPGNGWRPGRFREQACRDTVTFAQTKKFVSGENGGSEGASDSARASGASNPAVAEGASNSVGQGRVNHLSLVSGNFRSGGEAENIKMGQDRRRVNYWGFGPGWFFAPKKSYCAADNSANEFRDMVRSFHEARIEVIMEMDLPEKIDSAYMLSVILWWHQVYHVDGFVFMSGRNEANSLCMNPALSNVKLICDYFDSSRIYSRAGQSFFRNLAEYNAGFRNDARQLLKGDSGKLRDFVSRCRRNPKDEAVINAITGHDGFTLRDLVSYDNKHNEENGENNRDGAIDEYSWNCGAEGATRKKDIIKLRMRQIRNAFSMMLLSQGTPLLLAGDEMLNSQLGNSNPYCIDSELSWVTWSKSKRAFELTRYVESLIAFRKAHKLLHKEEELTCSSDGGFLPDFSCHGENAWYAPFDSPERSVGLMYAGKGTESIIYVAYNFHWDEKCLALPVLPGGRKWNIVIDTSREERYGRDSSSRVVEDGGAAKTISVPGRSVIVLEG